MTWQTEGIDPKLLEILVCPITKAPLTYNKKTQELTSKAAGLIYPIKEGIPIMLAEEAKPVKK
jgi:uncharacterized protein YbaR (Trm112 family)